LKLPIDEMARRTATVLIHTNQHPLDLRVRFVMGKWLAFEIGFQPFAPFRAVGSSEAFREYSQLAHDVMVARPRHAI